MSLRTFGEADSEVRCVAVCYRSASCRYQLCSRTCRSRWLSETAGTSALLAWRSELSRLCPRVLLVYSVNRQLPALPSFAAKAHQSCRILSRSRSQEGSAWFRGTAGASGQFAFVEFVFPFICSFRTVVAMTTSRDQVVQSMCQPAFLHLIMASKGAGSESRRACVPEGILKFGGGIAVPRFGSISSPRSQSY